MKILKGTLKAYGFTLPFVFELNGSNSCFAAINHHNTEESFVHACRLDDLQTAMWKNGMHEDFIKFLIENS